MNTLYTQQEATQIEVLSWYKDVKLTQIIEKLLIQSSPNTCLLDLCCGSSILLEKYLDLFDKYIGVDKSPYMVSKANNRAMKIGVSDRSAYYTMDIEEFISQHFVDKSISHILIKNALQFFDFGEILKSLKDTKDDLLSIVIIQTIQEYNDIFYLLPDLAFKHRIQKFYKKRELEKTIKQYASMIHAEEQYTQYISVSDWLRYHGATAKQIKDTFQNIKDLSDSEKDKHGISIKDDVIYLKRVLYCSLFSL